MKKTVLLLLIVLSIVLSFALTSCISDKNDMIVEATVYLEKYWKDIYEYDGIGDGYFEIKNTRVIYMKENATEQFKDVRCVIEFELYTDFFGSSPYYSNASLYNNVIVYDKDGSMEVASNVINQYRNKTFVTDFSDFIESIVDYRDEYNYTKNLK